MAKQANRNMAIAYFKRLFLVFKITTFFFDKIL